MATTGNRTNVDTELKRLRALIAQQQERLEALENVPAEAEKEGENGHKRSNRRELLKLAGAAVVGAAGTAAMRAVPAAAADGDVMRVGYFLGEGANFYTGVYLYGAASPFAVMVAEGDSTSTTSDVIGLWASPKNNAAGVQAYGGGSYSSAVNAWNFNGSYGAVGAFGYGYGGPGVWAMSVNNSGLRATTFGAGRSAVNAYTYASSAAGVYAYSQHGYAVSATSYGSTAVSAASYLSTAVYGLSNSQFFSAATFVNYGNGTYAGPDLKLGGTGRLVQVAQASGNLQPSYAPSYFELVRSDNGAVWGSTGSGGWKRINAVRTDSSAGNGNPFVPYRRIDTRQGSGAKANGTTTTYVIAGQGTGDSNIPADAIAVVGNVTAVGNPTLPAGYLTIAPTGSLVVNGSGDTPTSSVNFITGANATANAFVVGLTAGSLDLYTRCSSGTVHHIIDITGYVQ